MSVFYKRLLKLKKGSCKQSFSEFLYLTGQMSYEDYIRATSLFRKRLESLEELLTSDKIAVESEIKSNVKVFIDLNYPVLKGTSIKNGLIEQLKNKDLDLDSSLSLLSELIKTIYSDQSLDDLFDENEKNDYGYTHARCIHDIEKFLETDPFKNINNRIGYSYEDLLTYTKTSDFIDKVIVSSAGSFCSFNYKSSNISISSKWSGDEYAFKRATSLAHEIGHAYYQNKFISRLDLWGEMCLFPSLSDHETAAILFELVLAGIDVTEKNTGIRLTSDKLNYLRHILIRCKMEEVLFDEARKGTLNGSIIKELWVEFNLKYLSLKVEPESIKQDMHWFNGMFGYFYSYGIALERALRMYGRILPHIGKSIDEDIRLMSVEINKLDMITK